MALRHITLDSFRHHIIIVFLMILSPKYFYYFIFLHQKFKVVCNQVNLFLMPSGFFITLIKGFSTLIYLCVFVCMYCTYTHIYHSYSHLSSTFISFFGLSSIYCKEHSIFLFKLCHLLGLINIAHQKNYARSKHL